MIHCERFIYGYFKSIGSRTISSENVELILSTKSLRYLKRLNGARPIQTLLPEGYVAITFIENGMDEYDRETIWNNTFIMSVQDYFKLHEERDKRLFEGYVIHEMQNPYGTLKPLKVKTQ